MRRTYIFLKKFLCLVLLVSLFNGTAIIFAPKEALAQVSGDASGQVSTGFQAGGILATALQCSGVFDKLAGLLSNLFSVSEVPVGEAALRKKEECFDAIAHEIVVRVMDKITLATVDWINNGFEGQPLFLEDPQQFFENVAAKEINSLTGWFTASPEGYPFGQIVMTTILTNLQQQFAQNVQFSLNEVLAHGTYEEFRFDFTVGGWAGYSAFFEPNNNAFGNYLLVNQELGRRIGGTSINVGDNYSRQLSQSGGFLNQRKCVESATGQDDYIPSDDESGYHIPSGGAPSMDLYVFLIGGQPGQPAFESVYEQLQPGFVGPLTAQATDVQAQIEVYRQRSECKVWKTITPGGVIAGQLTTALNLPANQLIQADELNENLALIFDALLNQLVKTGLRSLNGTDPSTNVLLAQVQGQQPGQVSNGQVPPPSVDTITGTGYSQEPLVLVQQSYIQQAQQAMPVLDNLIRKIKALDYCVPGPHPSWVDDAQQNLENTLLGVGVFASSDPDPQDAEDANQDYYANAIQSLTGIVIEQSPAMNNHTQFMAFMNNLFAKYSEKMLNPADAGYNRFLTPPSTRIFLENLLNEMEVYQASYNDLNEYLNNITSYLPTLISIQTTINNIAQTNGGVVDQTNPQVQAQISLFESINSHFATEAQLNELQVNFVLFQNRETTVNGHLDSCITETVVGPYNNPNNRVTYPTPIFPYVHSVSLIPLPGPNDSFFDGVQFAGNTNNGNIDVTFGGVNITSGATLDIFEDQVLQAVY